MRILLIFTLLVSLTTSTQAQPQKTNCYLDYTKAFKERGAKPVPDGIQNVVVTIRNTADNSCVSRIGTIEVKDNKIVGKLMLKSRQGDLVKPKEKLNDKYQEPKTPMKMNRDIVNGMSSSFLTQNNSIVNLFFIDYLEGKMPALAEAPSVK